MERSTLIIPYEMLGGVAVGYYFWCPGCKCAHLFVIDIRYYGLVTKPERCPIWTFDGNLEVPTFTPSLRMYYTKPKKNEEVTTCHLFIKGGKIEYCTDCLHDLKGQTVPMQKIPADYHLGGIDP